MDREKLIALVQKVQAGDSDAMDALFSAYYNDVYYFALKTVKDPDTACDITQETFVEIIRTIGNLKEPAAFVTWMKQITYHQCTRHFNKKTDVLVDEDEDGNTIFDTLADEREGTIPSEVVEQEEFRRTILDMIDSLTEEQRAAVMLYYFDELSVGQIAAIQGVSEGTVKSRLNYARKALKKSVEGYEKKHNIKLHSFSFLPLFLLFFGKEAMPVAKAAAIRTTVLSAAKAATVGAATTAGAASATAATGGVMAKVAAIPLAGKLVAGALAVALVGGAVVMALPDSPKPEDTPAPESTSQETDFEETTPQEPTPPAPQGAQYESDVLAIFKPSLEYQNIFEEYLDGNLSFIRTNDGRIISRTNSFEDFCYSNIENVREAFLLQGRPAYFDTDGVLHVLYKGRWYDCAGITGQPFECYTHTDGAFHVRSHEKNGPIRHYRYDVNGEARTILRGIMDADTGETQTLIDARLFTLLSTNARTNTFLANGRFYISTQNSKNTDGILYYMVKDTGISIERLFSDPVSPYLVYKGNDNDLIYIHFNEELIQPVHLPEGKTADQITRAVSSGSFGSIIVFDDGSMYLHRWTSYETGEVTQPRNDLIYQEELTRLNQEGKIKDILASANNLHFVMDDNLTYTLRKNHVASAGENADN